MKRYQINCHYDIVIPVVVYAESEAGAIERAKEQAGNESLNQGECVGHSECVADCEELTAKETKRMKHDTIIQFVHNYIDEMINDTERKQELADMVYNHHRLSVVPWANGLSREYPDWQRKIFLEVTEWYQPFGRLCNRYARLYAHMMFGRYYKNTAKSRFDISVKGCDKLQKKQAVLDGMRVLCDKMEEYVLHQDDEDYKDCEPQMVIRYESATGTESNYWNLFVYCTGPNDQDGDDYLAVSTAWQHVWQDSLGNDATDDYGTKDYLTRGALLRHLFYGDPERFEDTNEMPIWERITDVWVD